MGLIIQGPGLDQVVSATGSGRARPATLFLDGPVLVTVDPPVHALQRAAYLDALNSRQAQLGLPALTEEQKAACCGRSADLFLKPGSVQIRPDPARMDLAFAADEALEELFPKPQRRFLDVDQPEVQQAIKERGELWRISALPSTKAEISQHIADAKTRISEQPIYYLNLYSGTRYVTCHEFARLRDLDSAALARQLKEIAVYASRRNRLGRPEVDFFMAEGHFGAKQFDGLSFCELNPNELAAWHERLRAQFFDAVPPEFHRDEPDLDLWRTEMYSVLISQRDETETEVVLAGLNLEFKQRIRWLPCGRFEQGELMFDEVFEAAAQAPKDPIYRDLCDLKVKDIVFNLIREFGLLDWVNVGRILASHNHDVQQSGTEGGRRDVYLAQIKCLGEKRPRTRFMRLQKYGVRERLAEGKDLSGAMLETEEYIAYILDRRLGCWYLGVNVALRMTMRRLQEFYVGLGTGPKGLNLPVTYFDREFIPGFPANQLPSSRYENREFANRFGRLLGQAAAANLIVGRGNTVSLQVVFDVGDEIVVEDVHGMPQELIICDNAGSFVCYQQTLLELAPAYAKPVNDRADKLAYPSEFALAYLEGFETHFRHVQAHYQQHRRAFDTLFKHTPPDPKGNFSYRWDCVLRRLAAADPVPLLDAIRTRIAVLPHPSSGQNP